MTLVEKLNLLWKFLFLAVFTYGVFSLTCCSSQAGCPSQSSCKKQCQFDNKAQKIQCAPGCTKQCCA